ncbi:MAG: TerC/Alx family metal homeostasis membrane protein [Alphaproteobacteria bacterium]|nr:TerC/Alx family metal homeostasis membrane protein [Alphaproteobacteria bacterium]
MLPSNLMWIVFGILIFALLFLDLFVFHKKVEEPQIANTLKMSIYYILIALIFGLFIIYEKGTAAGMLYYTGYLVEKSLSMDNIFVISLVFTSLNIPTKYQHRVLFWGILGAIVMRAVMIMIGAKLVSDFHWLLYVFSFFLLYTGIKMVVSSEEDTPLTETRIFKFIKRTFKITRRLHNEHFIIKRGSIILITPLLFALIVIELMDVIFAVDSIPAIFLITQDVYLVYTSNIFAILGLRALYFLLAAAVNRFTYLKPALAIILIFIGSKIFLPYIGINIEAWQSLIITFSIIAGGIILSLVKTSPEAKA